MMCTRAFGRRGFLGAIAAGATAGLLTGGCSAPGVPLGEQRGFALPTWERHGYRDFDTAGALRELHATGARWVQIVPTWYQDGIGAAEIHPTAASVVADDVRFAIRLAHDAGLRVLLKPHVNVLTGMDRGRVAPDDPDAWFASYSAFLSRWAVIAQEEAAEEFSVGTELRSLAGERARWLRVVDKVRGIYAGPLVYAANYDEYEAVTFWDAVDIIGIDGYWRLGSTPTTDVAQLRRAFTPIRDGLADLARRTGRRILFTEAGFPSQVGAAAAPWNDRLSIVAAPDEQAAAYRALLDSFSGQSWWAGVFWWTWTVPHAHSLTVPLALDHSVRGKPAAEVVRTAWHRPAL